MQYVIPINSYRKTYRKLDIFKLNYCLKSMFIVDKASQLRGYILKTFLILFGFSIVSRLTFYIF